MTELADHASRGLSNSRFWRQVDRLDRLVGVIGWIGLAVSAVFAALIFLVLIAGALTRPWSNFIFGFAYEVSSVMLWPISFLALAAVWRNQGHVRFDLFLRMTRRRRHHMLELASSAATLVVGVLFVWQAWVGLLSHYEAGTATLTFRYSVWPLFSTVFIGSVFLLMELIMSVLRSLREVIEPTGSEEAIYGAFTETHGL
jgi:TRAP-type C4-dicarboxylate transport system permease small subunit